MNIQPRFLPDEHSDMSHEEVVSRRERQGRLFAEYSAERCQRAEAEIERLRAELAESVARRVQWTCHLARAEEAEAKLARVRELCSKYADLPSYSEPLVDEILRAIEEEEA